MSYSPDSDLLDEEDSFIDSLDPPFEPYTESSVAIVQSPSAQMPSSPHRRFYPDQSRGSPPSSPLAQRSITRPSPMRRDASTSVPDGTINPFMGGWEATNSPSASSQLPKEEGILSIMLEHLYDLGQSQLAHQSPMMWREMTTLMHQI